MTSNTNLVWCADLSTKALSLADPKMDVISSARSEALVEGLRTRP